MIGLTNNPKRAENLSIRSKSEVSRKDETLRLNYRQRCSGKFVKPPYGAFVKSNGTQRYG